MTALLRHARDWGLAVLTASAVTFLIAADIVRTAGWTWAPIRALLGVLPTLSDQPRLIRNYSEFIRLPQPFLVSETQKAPSEQIVPRNPFAPGTRACRHLNDLGSLAFSFFRTWTNRDR